MNRECLNFCHRWFDGYASHYVGQDPGLQKNVDLKIRHTFRVCGNIRMIAESNDQAYEDQVLGQAIALFHDVGRFEQLKNFRSFDDRISADHALLSIEALNGWKGFYEISAEERNLIRKACMAAQ